jgi:sugar phosphate isomerase/epimerase
MRFGVCCSARHSDEVAAAGYDYTEANFTSLCGMRDEEFAAVAETYRKAAVPVYSTNCMFPGDLRLYEEDSPEKVRAYAEKGFERVASLGVQVCVVGSGAARRVPAHLTREEAEERFSAILALLGDLAAPYGIRLAIEPLNFAETDMVNTVADAVRLAERSGRDNVGALVDFFHFFMVGEQDDGLQCAGKRLFHVHLARANADRQMPKEEDRPTVEKWAGMLKEIGYDGAMSLEGGFGSDFAATITALRPMLELFA